MSDYYKILLSNRAEPSQEALSRAIEPRATPEPRQEPSQRQEPEPSQSRAREPEPSQRQEPRAEPIAKSHARAKPRGKRQGNITLYHYSQADFKDKIKVKFYGLNNYTFYDKNLTNIKRAFYYTKPEHLLKGSKFLYITDYPNFRLYDITKDLKGYLKDKTIDEALHQIKQKYNGVIYRIGKSEIVNLFYDTKYIKQIKRW